MMHESKSQSKLNLREKRIGNSRNKDVKDSKRNLREKLKEQSKEDKRKKKKRRGKLRSKKKNTMKRIDQQQREKFKKEENFLPKRKES